MLQQMVKKLHCYVGNNSVDGYMNDQVTVKGGILSKPMGLKCTNLNRYSVVVMLQYQIG